MSSIDVALQLVATLDRRVTDLEERMRAQEREIAALRGRLAPVATSGSQAVLKPPVETAAEHQDRERQEILAALERHSWNRVRAAAELGIPRRTFYRRLKALKLQ